VCFNERMQIFAKKPTSQKADEQIVALKQRAERLAEKRTGADSELSAATTARLSFMLEGNINDAKASSALQSRVDTARSSLAGIDEAIDALNAQIAEAERQAALERDREERNDAANEISREADVIEKLLSPWLEQTQKLATSFETLATVDWDAGAIAKYLSVCAMEISIAAPMTVGQLRHTAVGITDGNVRIPNRNEPPPMPVQPTREPMRKVMPTKPIKWTDPDTLQKRTWHSQVTVDLPESIAARAIALGAAVPVGHDLEKKARGIRKDMLPPDPSRCVDLDKVPVSKTGADAPAAISHSAFEPVDRGKPYVVKIPRQVA
jgi:hypothetical protein